jgi:hypothetical protein
MMKINHEGMAVPDGTMTMGMGMWLRPLPSRVLVRVVFVVNMQVFMFTGFMGVGNDERIPFWPQDKR